MKDDFSESSLTFMYKKIVKICFIVSCNNTLITPMYLYMLMSLFFESRHKTYDNVYFNVHMYLLLFTHMYTIVRAK